VALVQWPPVQKRPAIAAWLLLALGGVVAVAGPLLLGATPAKFGLGSLIPAAGQLSQSLGETVNPNVLGGALVIPTLLAAACAIGPRATRQPWRWVWGWVALAFLAILLLTQCRGAYLGVAAGALLLVTLRWPRLAWATVPVALAAVALLVSGAGLALVLDAMGSATGRSGLSGRLAIWQFAGEVAAANPLHGAGLGLFAAVQPYAEGVGRAPHAHNLLLQVMMDLGALGLAAYVAVLAGVAAMLVHLLRNRPAADHSHARRIATAEVYRRRLYWTLAAGAAAGLGGMLVHGLVDVALWGNKVAFFPWLLFALVASLYQDAKERL
jgi:O-antigen ligase